MFFALFQERYWRSLRKYDWNGFENYRVVYSHTFTLLKCSSVVIVYKTIIQTITHLCSSSKSITNSECTSEYWKKRWRQRRNGYYEISARMFWDDAHDDDGTLYLVRVKYTNSNRQFRMTLARVLTSIYSFSLFRVFFFSRIASAAGCWACSERCSGECVGSKSIQLWIVYKLFEIGVKTRQHWFWFPSVFRSVLRAEVIHDNVQCNMFEAVVRNVAVFDTDFLYNCIFSIC